MKNKIIKNKIDIKVKRSKEENVKIQKYSDIVYGNLCVYLIYFVTICAKKCKN